MNSGQIRFNSSKVVERRMVNIVEQALREGVIDQEVLREADAYTNAILKREDQGWELVSGLSAMDSGFELQQLKEIIKETRKASKRDPLLIRGRKFKNDLVLGRGAPIEGELKPRFDAQVKDIDNQRSFFGHDAMVAINESLFKEGGVYKQYNRLTKKISTIMFEHIVGAFTNPALPSEVWYLKIQYQETGYSSTTGEKVSNKVEYWAPTDRYTPPSGSYLPSIDGVRVDSDVRILDLTINGEDDSPWGTPEVLAAMTWAWAYSEGLRSDLKLRAALAAIAWLVKQKTTKGAANAGAKFATKGTGIGKTAVGTDGTELTSMPRAGAIDSKELLPHAGQVASALEVPLAVLVSNSGVASGSAAAEGTLDPPTQRAGETRQRLIASYYDRMFLVMGIPRDEKFPTINFPKITVDSVHRYLQSLALADEHGVIYGEEFRAASLEALDIVDKKGGKLPPARAKWEKKTFSTNQNTPSTVSGQGVNGAVGAVDDGDNDAAATAD